MPYVAIPTNLKNVNSISLNLMSPEDMIDMSYGEVLTAETINYRTGLPQMNGLFCQAIFGPTKDWECACGKYKRYRYAGVVCDKCGVEVTTSQVRRERMGHISLAAPCVHPWFLRVIPSRIALLLDMKSTDLSRVTYFSSYVVTEIREEVRQEYLVRIDKECEKRIKDAKQYFESEFERITKEYQSNKHKNIEQSDILRQNFELTRDMLRSKQVEEISKIEAVAEIAKQQLSALTVKDILPESMHQELATKYGPVFKASIGAEAVQELLANLNLPVEYDNLKKRLAISKGQTKKKYARRLNLIKHFLNNGTQPEWMILNRIMVLPPDLRPMLQLDGGRFAASDLNELYRRLINRNNRLRKLIQIGAPEVILRNEKRMLQEAVEALIDNSVRGGKQVMASTGVKRPLKSLTDILKGKNGRFRQNLLGKRVDYSGRSVIIVGPHLKLDECGIPKQIAMELFKPFLMGRIISKSEAGILEEENQCFNVHSARRLIESKKSVVYDILEEVIADKYVLLNRAPTLHRLSFLAFKPTLVEGKAIQIHPLVCRAFNADFDGDQMAVHLPITIKGQEEAKNLMLATKNLLKPASGEIIMSGGTLDIILGSYYLTMTKDVEPKKGKYYSSMSEVLLSFNNDNINLHEIVSVKLHQDSSNEMISTTPGRIIFNSCFPDSFPFVNDSLNKKLYEKTISEAYLKLGKDQLPAILDKVKHMAYKYATQSGISLSAGDFKIPQDKFVVLDDSRDKVSDIQNFYQTGLTTNEERYRQIISVWREASDIISKMTEKAMDEDNNVGIMIKSGAKGNISQLNLIAGIRGLSVTAAGNIIELPAQHGYLEGLTGLEYFISMKGQRKGQSDISLRTADAGYLTRRLVDVAQNVVINLEDCGTTEGVILRQSEALKYGKSLYSMEGRLYGRYLQSSVTVEEKVIAKKNSYVDNTLLKIFEKYNIQEFFARTPTKCSLHRGVCQKCYGADFSTHKPVDLGVPVGIIAAQSLGENSTQLTMDQGKHGKGLLKSDITEGLGRVEEIFEVRSPKYKAPFLNSDGIVRSTEGAVDQGFKLQVESTIPTISLPYDSTKDILLVENDDEITVDNNLLVKETGEVIRSSISGKLTKFKNKLTITQTKPEILEFNTIPGYYLKVRQGDTVKKGQPLTEGSFDLQEVMDRLGFDDLQDYIINQLIGIYSENGILVNEKHIEVIIRQMCSRVQIVDAGDTDYIVGDLVRYSLIINLNKQLQSEGKKPATFNRSVTGISRASLITDSFLSAASFQEASKVLVEAVISGRSDDLLGLKENVILGQLIPAGTGFKPIDSSSQSIVFDDFVDEVSADDL
jgi:DNA-directed RNA polymerase subunit beta'